MKLRSGKCLSTADCSVAPVSKIGPNKSKPEVFKKACIVKQKNESYIVTSDSSCESVPSDSYEQTWSAPPKSAVRKRSSKVVPLKKFNIRGSSAPHKKSTRQMSTGQSVAGKETALALVNDLRNLSISDTENTIKRAPEVMLVNKVVKQRSLLLKKRLLENTVPPEQTGGLPCCDVSSSQADHFKSPDAADNEDENNFPKEVTAVDETIMQGLESPCQSGNCRILSFSREDNTAKEGQSKGVKRNSSKCRQATPKHRNKLLDTSTTGTVKCATSVKTLVTKTLSGNTCKVVPVICIESSSSSEEEYCDRNSVCGNDTVKSNVALKNTMPTIRGKVGNEELELEGNCDLKTNKSVLKSVKIEERDIPNQAPKISLNCEVRNKNDDSNSEESVFKTTNGSVVENTENHTGKTKSLGEAAGRPNALGRVQTENVHSITKKKGIISSMSVAAKLPARQTQTSSTQYQSGNRQFPANAAVLSSEYFLRSNWGPSQPSYQYQRNRSAWEMTSRDWGSHWNMMCRNVGLSRQRRHEWAGADFDLQGERVPVITESNARNVSLLSHDYNRLGDALTRSYAAASVENYYVQQARLPAAHVTAPQRFNTGTGMQNPVSMFGGNVYLPSSQPMRKQGLRPIVIDGSNVAMGHGCNFSFSYRGLQICVDYFVRRGHKVIAFLPQHRKCGLAAKDRLVLQQLEKGGHVVFTPSRRVDNRLVVPYDDWYIVQCAAVLEGVIVSNDNYRDLLSEDAEVSRAIKERLLMYTWVDNLLMFPKDPLGRGGPTLDQFLSFPAA